MINKITNIIKKIIGGDIRFSVTIPEKPEFGHYSTNAAFLVSEDPEVLAEKIAKAGRGLFEKAEPAGKFINFWISPLALKKELPAVMKPQKYPDIKKKKIIVEFISANPTGPLTMANGRGGFLGDVLCRVLETVGHKIAREYYINDTGNQIKLLGESILAALGKIPEKEEYYKGKYIKDLSESLRNTKYNPEELGRLAAGKLLKQIQKSIKNSGIKFDTWFSEYKNLHQKSELKKILAILEKDNLIVYKDGATWLKSDISPAGEAEETPTLQGRGPDRSVGEDYVLVKSDGSPTYFLADLAYHCDKFLKRKFDSAIDIWGADHHGYAARLKSGLKALKIDPAKLKIIIIQLVRLIEGGRESRMSKRRGEFIALDELIKEVGLDAARFFFLTHSPDSHMDFDLKLAKERSLKNPVYYLQYAYVRANSILKKSIRQLADKNQIKAQFRNLKLLNTASELNLIRELIKLPDIIRQTAGDYQLNRLTRYAIELARAFHNFYEKERVINEEKNIMLARLYLVSAAKTILRSLFDLLGISALEKM